MESSHDSVTLTCPHCGADDSIAEYNEAVSWCQIEDSEIAIDADGNLSVMVASPDGDYDGYGWICTSCLRRDIDMPVHIELDYC